MHTTRYFRISTIAVLTALLAFVGVQSALAANPNSIADPDVIFDSEMCRRATITSDKGISNVVVVLTNGTFEKFEAPEDFDEEMLVLTLEVASDVDDIERLFVKSGSFKRKVEGFPGMVGDEFLCPPPV